MTNTSTTSAAMTDEDATDLHWLILACMEELLFEEADIKTSSASA